MAIEQMGSVGGGPLGGQVSLEEEMQADQVHRNRLAVAIVPAGRMLDRVCVDADLVDGPPDLVRVFGCKHLPVELPEPAAKTM